MMALLLIGIDGLDGRLGRDFVSHEDSAAATACRSTDTSSLVANLASWLSLSLARSKKRPFVHSAALGRERAARRRAAIRSTAVAAASRSSIRAVHRANAALSIW